MIYMQWQITLEVSTVVTTLQHAKVKMANGIITMIQASADKERVSIEVLLTYSFIEEEQM